MTGKVTFKLVMVGFWGPYKSKNVNYLEGIYVWASRVAFKKCNYRRLYYALSTCWIQERQRVVCSRILNSILSFIKKCTSLNSVWHICTFSWMKFKYCTAKEKRRISIQHATEQQKPTKGRKRWADESKIKHHCVAQLVKMDSCEKRKRLNTLLWAQINWLRRN